MNLGGHNHSVQSIIEIAIRCSHIIMQRRNEGSQMRVRMRKKTLECGRQQKREKTRDIWCGCRVAVGAQEGGGCEHTVACISPAMFILM